MTTFDDRICALGEGALWHPERQELFWFDVTGKRLLARVPDGPTREIILPRMCSAAAWIGRDRLLIASETDLSVFHIERGEFERHIADLESDNPATRSNDGRADPWGGFWISTMGKSGEPGEGAIYRLFDGRLQRLFSDISVPNAICFAPDRSVAYYADTDRGQIYRVPLNDQGWPTDDAEVFVDLTPLGFWPDGAVTLADGSLAVALWGEGAVLRISAVGEIGQRHKFDAPHTTCPAMGGPDFRTLFCTSATQGLSPEGLEHAPLSGATFTLADQRTGLPEPAFDLSTFGETA